MPALRSAVAAVAATAAGALVLTAAAPVAASGLHEPPPWTVVTGLNNPRGITFGPDGALFVAESGRGGAGPCQAGPEGGEVCFGRSGSITRIKNGRSYRIVTQLPSLASRAGTEAAGPSDVGVDRHGKLYFTVGLGGAPSLRTEVPASARDGQAVQEHAVRPEGGRRHRRVRAAGQPGRHLAAGHQPAGPGRGRQFAVRRRRGRQLAGQGQRPGPHLDRRHVQGA